MLRLTHVLVMPEDGQGPEMEQGLEGLLGLGVNYLGEALEAGEEDEEVTR